MKLQAEMNLAHLNVRREKAGDEEGPIAIDLKLTGTLPIAKLEELFATIVGYNVMLANIFREDGELIAADMESFTLSTENENMEGQLQWGLLKEKNKVAFKKASFGSIRITPIAGRQAELSCRLQINPSKNELSSIASVLGEQVDVTIAPMQGSLELQNESGDTQH